MATPRLSLPALQRLKAGQYRTVDGRFILTRLEGNGWQLRGVGRVEAQWIRQAGLLHLPFDSRAEAHRTLAAALIADGRQRRKVTVKPLKITAGRDLNGRPVWVPDGGLICIRKRRKQPGKPQSWVVEPYYEGHLRLEAWVSWTAVQVSGLAERPFTTRREALLTWSVVRQSQSFIDVLNAEIDKSNKATQARNEKIPEVNAPLMPRLSVVP